MGYSTPSAYSLHRVEEGLEGGLHGSPGRCWSWRVEAGHRRVTAPLRVRCRSIMVGGGVGAVSASDPTRGSGSREAGYRCAGAMGDRVTYSELFLLARHGEIR